MNLPHGRLLVGCGLAMVGNALIPTTLTLAVIGGTGSAADLGIVLSAELLPLVLLLPFAGVVADRLRPERIILVTDLVRAAAQLAIGIELLCGLTRIPDLAALSAVTGAAVAFGSPAALSLVAATVPGPERLRTNARLGVVQGLSQVAAPSVAGGLTLTLGAGWSSVLTGGLFVLSALTIGGMRTSRTRERTRHGAFLGELREGWAETRRHRWFLYSVLGHGVWHLAAGFLLTLGPIIAMRHLGGESSWVAIVQIGMIGLVAGISLAGRLPIRRPLVVSAVCAAAYAFPLAAFGLHAPMPVVTAAYCVAMFGLGLLSPLWETAMQHRIPEEALGRVGSFDSLISFAARPLGLAAAAPIAAVTGTAAPLLIGAVLVAVANLAVLLLPDVRKEPARETAAQPEPVR
jgi:MFS family permease